MNDSNSGNRKNCASASNVNHFFFGITVAVYDSAVVVRGGWAAFTLVVVIVVVVVVVFVVAVVLRASIKKPHLCSHLHNFLMN